MKIIFKALLANLLIICGSYSQSLTTSTVGSGNAVTPSDFALPQSPAFFLLDANSAMVATPGVIRDFKVDWSLKSYSLSPNLSLEAQPIWLFFYDNADISKYRKANPAMRALSTLSLSFGTLDTQDTLRLMAFAVKMNMFMQEDPLLKKDIFNDIEEEYKSSDSLLQARLEPLKKQYEMETYSRKKDSVLLQIIQSEKEIYLNEESAKEKISQRKKDYMNSEWNKTYVDFAFGRSFIFNKKFARVDSAFKDLKTNSTGFWVNGSLGIGHRMLLTGIYKLEISTHNMPDSLKTVFKITGGKDSIIRSMEYATAIRTSHLVGFNLRYGSPRFSFFIEGVHRNIIEAPEYSKWETISADSVRNNPSVFFKKDLKSSAILPEGTENIIAYGGEFKLGNQVQLNFSLRTVFNKDLKFLNLLPVATVSCLMK